MRVAFVNTFFDGYDIWNAGYPIINWLMIHSYKTPHIFLKRIEKNVESRNEHSHPINKIIKANPDIIVACETFPYKESRTLRELNKNKYQVVIGYDNIQPKPAKRAVVIASNLKITQMNDFSFSANTHYGGCACIIEDLGLIICGIHASHNNQNDRIAYFQYINKYLKKKVNQYPNYRIILCGDFNQNLEDTSNYFKDLKLDTVQLHTFPSLKVWRELDRNHWKWLKNLIGANRARKSIDQVYFTNSLKLLGTKSIETISDHDSVIIEFD